MNQLMKNDIKMTSLDISEIVGKKHLHVMRDIRTEIKNIGEEVGKSIFGSSSYTTKQNKEQPCYVFGKEGAMQLALKYDAKTRYRVIKRIEELENGQNKLPSNYKEALTQLLEQVEEKEKLETQNGILNQQVNELQPKATYYDLVLQNKSLLSISKIAKDYGWSANKMNKKLHDLGIQYKQGDIWLLYQKHTDKGYTQSTTHVIDEEKSRLHTKWTQKGRLFIYETLKNEGVLPLIEREEENATT